ncbi:MAG: DUF853 family protein [Rhodanobacter sp.]|nr:MAG: DUF853 family protein [Rhodanobacter sp.]
MTEILIGSNAGSRVSPDPRYGNPHGTITGATGTGESVSLMVLVDGFSKLGVPCFLADARGDLAGLAMAVGEPGDKLKACLAKLQSSDCKGHANPDNVPGNILGQLGNPIPHALRVFTPRDRKALKAAADTFVTNPDLEVSTALAMGETLASTRVKGGVPTAMQRVLLTTPCCRIGSINGAERATIRLRSPLGAKYDTAIKRESAAEILAQRADDKAANATDITASAPDRGGTAATGSSRSGAVHDAFSGTQRCQGMIGAMDKQIMRTVGSQTGRRMPHGVVDGIFGGKR